MLPKKLQYFDLIMHLDNCNLITTFLVLPIPSCRCRSLAESSPNTSTSDMISYSTSPIIINLVNLSLENTLGHSKEFIPSLLNVECCPGL